MRKKITAFAAAALGVALLGAGGTYASYTDTEAAPVLVEAGRLDLSLSSGEDLALQPLTFTGMVPGPAPQQGGYVASDRFYHLRLNNDGTVPGRVLWRSVGLAERDNGCNEPEIAAGDTTCRANQVGELGNQLLLSFALMARDDCTGTPGTVPPATYPPTARLGFQDIKPGGAGPALVIPPGESRCVRIDVYFPESPQNNLAQSDTSSFRLDFRMNQAS